MRSFWFQLKRHHITDLGAQIAFFYMLSFIPFLLLILFIVNWLPVDTEAIIALVLEQIPKESHSVIKGNISAPSYENTVGLVIFNFLALVFASSNAVHSTIRAIHRAYEINETRSFIFVKLLSVGFIGLIISALVILVFFPLLGEWMGRYIFVLFGLSELFIDGWMLLRFPISLLLIAGLLSILYKYGTSVRVPFRQTWKGSLFASLGWVLSGGLLSLYIKYFPSASVTQGSLGGIILLLLWFYLIGLLLVIGAEINAFFYKRSKTCENSEINPEDHSS